MQDAPPLFFFFLFSFFPNSPKAPHRQPVFLSDFIIIIFFINTYVVLCFLFYKKKIQKGKNEMGLSRIMAVAKLGQ